MSYNLSNVRNQHSLILFCYKDLFKKKKKEMSESAIKYFIIQSISSSILIFSSICIKRIYSFTKSLIIMIVISLIIKTGSTPFHQWFVNIVKKILWKNNTILITWQKLAPVYLILYQVKSLILPFILIRRIVGALIQMNKKNTIEIIGFSSVFNLRWIILAIIINTYIFLVFCFIYWIAVIIVIVTLKRIKLENIYREKSIEIKKWLILAVIINLGGIPPMAGFISKWIVFSESIKHNILMIITFLLVTRSINLYIYIRLTNNQIIKNSLKAPKIPSKPKKTISMIITLISSVPLIMISF